jgi:hypothetical protein
MTGGLQQLKSIKSFPSLVKYLRDELDWPIDSNDVEDLTFEYEPEELGLERQTAVKIREIKQLRPFTNNQPWGIFYINFEPKRLPVVALRRILSKLVIRKRASANKTDRQAWQPNDLLFVSSYGEQEAREMTLAHFSDNSGSGDLPTLKVLGWDAQDTPLSLEYTHKTLKEKLRFPVDPSKVEAWREQWASAFTLRHREVVTTSIELARRLAVIATLIRERAGRVLAIESDRGAFRRLHEAFKEALIHDLSADDFADMYAQTIAYGLLSARVSRPAGLVADNLVDMVPSTNPFLKELLGTFLEIGGRDTSRASRKANAIDFDELGINEVVELLRRANMEAVLRDFGNRNPTEDPVIHFYELFLKEYDPVKRMKRGVFYTPLPVVSFIVRSVHEILQTEFGLAGGLADTTTWGEFVKRQKIRNPQSEIRIPEGVSADAPFVQILDPATGTGTFLVETIDVIYRTLTEKWRGERKNEAQIRELWNDYVPKHLLPRLYGFELMMAPYSIAHMKIGLKLRETHYSFLSSERARIYLTNTLEEPKDFSGYFAQMAPALAHEAAEANHIKRHTPITVVIGNPPYSKVSSNMGAWAISLLKLNTIDGVSIQSYYEVDGEPLGERKVWLQDDYVKCLRIAQYYIKRTGLGVLGYITNHGFLGNPTFNGLRQSLMRTFASITLVNLHGDTNVGETRPAGVQDENVFDIQQGVAISLMQCRDANQASGAITYLDLWGTREQKYTSLQDMSYAEVSSEKLSPASPLYLLVPINTAGQDGFQAGWSLPEIMPLSSSGMVTSRDGLVIGFDDEEILKRIRIFLDPGKTDEEVADQLGLSENYAWRVADARKSLRADADWRSRFINLQYRPFDKRRLIFHPAVVWRTRAEMMSQMIAHKNIGLLATRQASKGFTHVFCTRDAIEMKSCSYDRNTELFPLWTVNTSKQNTLIGGSQKVANLSHRFVASLAQITGLTFNESKRSSAEFDTEDVFHYLYAILNAPIYRSLYREFLSRSYPRIQLTSDIQLFRSLSQLGANLAALHLLEDDYAAASWNNDESNKVKDEEIRLTSANPLAFDLVRFHNAGSLQVAKGYPKYEGGKVYLNPGSYFDGVTEAVWNFHVGGYQVAHKWLKDRRERTLSPGDIRHYTRTCHAIASTIEHMRLIDETIEAHGGFPLVGSQDAAPKEATSTLPFA